MKNEIVGFSDPASLSLTPKLWAVSTVLREWEGCLCGHMLKLSFVQSASTIQFIQRVHLSSEGIA